MTDTRRALLSVSDKTGIVDFARGLAQRGFGLVSTGGTARALVEAGLDVTPVSTVTGIPEMLDGRVKTLHPAIHGGILARRDRPDDLAALMQHGIGVIDLVAVNLYPFAAAAANPGLPFEELVEEIDIGGPSLVRAAAKNYRDVLVIVDPADYRRVLDALDAGPSLDLRFDLMRKAFEHTAHYDGHIAHVLSTGAVESGRVVRQGPQGGRENDFLDERLALSLERVRTLRYGENPHQQAAWYRPGADRQAAGFGAAVIVQGKELSYTNLLDLDAAARIVCEFLEPAAVVVKHTNPCGVAIGRTAEEAYIRARDADRLSAFGGIVALNLPIDPATARAIASTKIDAVIAPRVDDDAREILGRRAAMRVVTADLDGYRVREAESRSILGGMLFQDRDQVTEARDPWSSAAAPGGFRVATRRAPTDAEWEALRFAWRVCAHVKSNAVVFSDDRRTLAIGAGQVSRVDAARVAVMMARDAKDQLVGSAVATDGFFPFRDGVDVVAGAGATAVIHPGGSLRDEEVIAAADEHGMAMVLTGIRHFRH
jgi:phosphoribosylaminoimidazolecarboxamide formyltransferase/IMP cyclohydrolase